MDKQIAIQHDRKESKLCRQGIVITRAKRNILIYWLQFIEVLHLFAEIEKSI